MYGNNVEAKSCLHFQFKCLNYMPKIYNKSFYKNYNFRNKVGQVHSAYLDT